MYGSYYYYLYSDKLMDALFQEGQSAPQTPKTFFDVQLTSKVWPAASCIFVYLISLIRKIVRSRLGLISATSWYMQWYMLCKVITANIIKLEILVLLLSLFISYYQYYQLL